METVFYYGLAAQVEGHLHRLLSRVVAEGGRALVLAPTAVRVQDLNNVLWTLRQESFLPHGAEGDGEPSDHPVWLTERLEHVAGNVNGSQILVLADSGFFSLSGEGVSAWPYRRCLCVVNGEDALSVDEAHRTWRALAERGDCVRGHARLGSDLSWRALPEPLET